MPLERRAGRRDGARVKKKKGIGSRGVDMAKKKKVPSGNVWKKSKGTSFGVVVAAWLPV